MTLRLNSVKFRNSPSGSYAFASSTAPASLGFKAVRGADAQCVPKLPILAFSGSLRSVLQPMNSRGRSVFFSFAASHEESSSDIEIEKKVDADSGAQEESEEEAWRQALAAFKEQTLKMQAVSKEAYESYSKKAILILKETSENFKIQADRARQDLSVVAKEIADESKHYFETAAENSPQPLKEIVETFTSSSPSDLSQVQDFHVGIPYGTFLSVGGFLSFMATGSIPAIRFGIILGGTILALSVLSLQAHKNGIHSFSGLAGQAVISSILFVREVQKKPPFGANLIATLISGGVLAFYVYRIFVEWRGKSSSSSSSSSSELGN